MKKLLVVVAFAVVLLSMPSAASAQATRTWVSGVGDDVNPCSRTAPCKTWAGAISKTAAGGEIDALDPGGFGTLTVTKSITVEGAGTHASALNSGGINGFVINITNPAEEARVVLRNISINGAGTTKGLTACGSSRPDPCAWRTSASSPRRATGSTSSRPSPGCRT